MSILKKNHTAALANLIRRRDEIAARLEAANEALVAARTAAATAAAEGGRIDSGSLAKAVETAAALETALAGIDDLIVATEATIAAAEAEKQKKADLALAKRRQRAVEHAVALLVEGASLCRRWGSRWNLDPIVCDLRGSPQGLLGSRVWERVIASGPEQNNAPNGEGWHHLYHGDGTGIQDPDGDRIEKCRKMIRKAPGYDAGADLGGAP